MEQQVDKKLIGKFQRIFSCIEGLDVLDDLEQAAQINEPFGSEISDSELRYRTGWHDAVRYIKAMVDHKGEENE